LLIENTKIDGRQAIAEQFNTFFTQMGPKLAEKINSANKRYFETYLLNENLCQFYFALTDYDDVKRIISSFAPKTNTGHDEISMKILKKIKDILAEPWSFVINQSLHFYIKRKTKTC